MDLNIVITTFAFNWVHPRILEGHVTFGDPCQFQSMSSAGLYLFAANSLLISPRTAVAARR
jgi:hypothetical protein